MLSGTDAGLLFPPGNADALAAAVDRMLTEPGLAAKCQAAGTELVRTTLLVGRDRGLDDRACTSEAGRSRRTKKPKKA